MRSQRNTHAPHHWLSSPSLSSSQSFAQTTNSRFTQGSRANPALPSSRACEVHPPPFLPQTKVSSGAVCYSFTTLLHELFSHKSRHSEKPRLTLTHTHSTCRALPRMPAPTAGSVLSKVLLRVKLLIIVTIVFKSPLSLSVLVWFDFESGSCCVELLPQPLKCWHHRCKPPHSAFHFFTSQTKKTEAQD